MSGTREEERRKLADIINHWNANRLDLFEISQPTEVGAAEAARPPPPRRLDPGIRPGTARARRAACSFLPGQRTRTNVKNGARFRPDGV